MKRMLTVSAGLLTITLAATPTLAADMPVSPVTKAPPVVAPVFDWTGFYVGLNGGVAWHRMKADVLEPVPNNARISASGATFGGQIGYNWQWQNYVTGVEADLNWVNARGSTSNTIVGTGVFNYTTKLSWLATVRARAGVTLAPPTLLYLTGGLAFGRVRNYFDFANGIQANQTEHRTRTGWTVGGGIEHMFAPNWTAKAEVLYVDLGRKTVSGFVGAVPAAARFKNTATVARVGVNLKW